jgi:predicted peroxiredoxin
MAKFLFVLSRGLEDPVWATRTMQFARFALEEGHEVTLFLIENGVYFAVLGMMDDVAVPTGEKMKDLYDFLAGKKVPVLVCTPCVELRKLDPEDFIENARTVPGKMLIQLAVDHKVIQF